ncbi:hypothetical protein H0H93_009888, partial [Arthromyces matolae]
SAVIVWVVHAIKFSNNVAVIDTLEQLANIGTACAITAWARKSVNILTAYRSGVLSNFPERIRKCWPMESVPGSMVPLVRTWQIAHEVTTEATTQSVYRLPLTEGCEWIHYDPRIDLLLAIESNLMCLRLYLMKSGVSLRPGIVPSIYPEIPSYTTLRVAAVSPSSEFVAAIFLTPQVQVHDEINPPHRVIEVCWRLPSPPSTAISQAQPELILCENYNATPLSDDWSNPDPGPHLDLAFAGDDLLLTPRGMWNIKRREWLPGHASVYQSVKTVNDYCFSGNGKRAARFDRRDDELKFFEVENGCCISRFKSPDTEGLLRETFAFSHSGQKALFYTPLKTGRDNFGKLRCCGNSTNKRPSCFIVDNQSRIDLDLPNNARFHSVRQAQFSSDEETIVAFVDLCLDSDRFTGFDRPVIIGLWKLIKDSEGRYTHAPFAYFHKEWSHIGSFCLVPAFHDNPETAFFVVDPGVVKQLPLSKTWSEEDVVLHQNPYDRQEIVKLDPREKTIAVTTLSKRRTLDAPLKSITSWSSSATYFVADEALLQLNEQKGLLLSTHKQRIEATAFSGDDNRIVILHYDNHNSRATLIMNDICDGSLSTIATSTVDTEANPNSQLSFRMNFNPVDPSHFILTMKICSPNEENCQQDAMDQAFRVISFKLLARQLVSTEIHPDPE